MTLGPACTAVLSSGASVASGLGSALGSGLAVALVSGKGGSSLFSFSSSEQAQREKASVRARLIIKIFFTFSILSNTLSLFRPDHSGRCFAMAEFV